MSLKLLIKNNKPMKTSKRIRLEKMVFEFIKNKQEQCPFINIIDVAAYLFELKPIGNNPSRHIERKKFKAKIHHAKSIVESLIRKKLIMVDCEYLQSLVVI